MPRWQHFEGGVAWWSVAPGNDVEQDLHFGWVFAHFCHHLLVFKVDRKLRSRESSARPLGIIDLLDIDEDRATRSLEEIGGLMPGASARNVSTTSSRRCVSSCIQARRRSSLSGRTLMNPTRIIVRLRLFVGLAPHGTARSVEGLPAEDDRGSDLAATVISPGDR
jgi:hypothetical protein